MLKFGEWGSCCSVVFVNSVSVASVVSVVSAQCLSVILFDSLPENTERHMINMSNQLTNQFTYFAVVETSTTKNSVPEILLAWHSRPWEQGCSVWKSAKSPSMCSSVICEWFHVESTHMGVRCPLNSFLECCAMCSQLHFPLSLVTRPTSHLNSCAFRCELWNEIPVVTSCHKGVMRLGGHVVLLAN